MDAELEIRRLQRRVQELEQENAELRAQLAAFGLSSSAQGKAGDTVFSAAQMPSNTAATLDAPAPNTVTPSHNRQSIPPARSAPLPVARTSSPPKRSVSFVPCFAAAPMFTPCAGTAKRRRRAVTVPFARTNGGPACAKKGAFPAANVRTARCRMRWPPYPPGSRWPLSPSANMPGRALICPGWMPCS